ncbi:hypothetical protein HRbin24_01965 [bacterium HR24]|jgi:uncharacterized OsmC-like protein|nr:hypothetical protein HRbin24_01965 [bacterium HR24]
MSHGERPRRHFTYEAQAEFLTEAFKRARAGRSDGVQHFIFSDESPEAGGQGSAPSPLAYLTAALGL